MLRNFLKYSEYNKKQKQLFFVFILLSILNFGNYSFLHYNLFGAPTSNPILLVLKNIRPFIPMVFILYLMRFPNWRSKMVKAISQYNFLFLLSILFIVNSIISVSVINSLVYSTWLFALTLVIALTVNEVTQIKDVFKFLKYGSIVTLVIVLPSIPLIIAAGSEATFFSSKNYYAYPLLIYFVSELFIFQKEKKINYKIIRYTILGLILMVLFLSGRRSATIAALLTLSIYIYNNSKLIFVLSTFSLFSFGTLLVTTDIFGLKLEDTQTYKRIERIFLNDDFEDSSYSSRQELWNEYLKGLDDSPILGHGLNTHESTLTRNYSGELEDLGYHNTFLQILVESGFMGFTFFLIFLIPIFIKFISFNNKLLYFSVFAPTLIIDWVESNFLPGQVFFIYSVTVWILLHRLSSKRNIA